MGIKTIRGLQLIQSFFLINRNGICYLSRNYANLEFDDALLAGFLAGLKSLGTKLFKEDEISEIDYGVSKFIYTYEKELVAVAIIDKTENPKPIKKALSDILHEFVSTFNVERILKGEIAGIENFYPFVDNKFQSLKKEKEYLVDKMDEWIDSF